MKTHKLNVKLSEKVFNSCKKHIALKDCYANIWRVTAPNMQKFNNGEWKVTYGYMPSVCGLYVRHCFIVNQDGEAIDPTAVLIQKELQSELPKETYISFAVLDFDEYLTLVSENDFILDLVFPLREKENELKRETNLVFIG